MTNEIIESRGAQSFPLSPCTHGESTPCPLPLVSARWVRGIVRKSKILPYPSPTPQPNKAPEQKKPRPLGAVRCSFVIRISSFIPARRGSNLAFTPVLRYRYRPARGSVPRLPIHRAVRVSVLVRLEHFPSPLLPGPTGRASATGRSSVLRCRRGESSHPVPARP